MEREVGRELISGKPVLDLRRTICHFIGLNLVRTVFNMNLNLKSNIKWIYVSFLFAWNDDFWSQQIPHTVDFLSSYVAILFLRYFPSLTARVYVVTSVHYITALVSLYVCLQLHSY